MASTQPPYLSVAPPHHSPSTIATFLILISVCVVPFIALSPELIPRTLPSAVFTLWDSLLGVTTTFPFYFFLLNLLIVALICLSGVFNSSSSTHRESDEVQEGDPHRRDYLSAAHDAIQESLALNQFYETQAPSPSYSGFVESSSICVVDEARGDEQALQDNEENGNALRKKTSNLLENPASLNDECRGNVTSSASETHLTADAYNAKIKMDAMERIPAVEISMIKHRSVLAFSSFSPVSKNGHTANVHHEVFPEADNIISTKDVQVCDDGQHAGDAVRETIKDDATEHGERESKAQSSDGDVDLRSAHDDGDGKLEFQVHDEGQYCEETRLQDYQAKLQTQGPWMGEVDEQGNVGECSEKGSLKDDGTAAMARNAGEVEDAAEKAGQDMELQQHEQEQREEEQLMMSREELNERASAFITAFRRKLISTAIAE